MRFRTARRSIHIDGLVACWRRHASDTEPLRFADYPFDGRSLARSRRLPRSPWLKGWPERGFAGLPPGVPRRVCSACRFCRFGTMWQRWMRTDERINTIAPTR
jgi:hypothetical protein